MGLLDILTDIVIVANDVRDAINGDDDDYDY